MRCPSCTADNPDAATKCAACGGPLKASRGGSRVRGHVLPEAAEDPWGRLGEGSNRPARLAYHLAVIGLVPGLGLVLGPAALALGVYAGRRGRGDPAFNSVPFVRTAVGLGLAEGLTNWAGLVLMILGWR
jgi:hypothetical protein